MLEELIKTALKLERGGVYVIRCEEHLSVERLAHIAESLDRFAKSHDIEFLVLDGGLRLETEALNATGAISARPL